MESTEDNKDPVALYSEEDIKEIKEKFESFDVDANGGLTTIELKRLLQILGYNPTTAEVEEMFQEMDSDGTGQLELPEFMTLMRKIEKYKQIKRTKEHFEIAYDTLKREDSDGGEAYIPVDSLRKLLTSLGETMTDEEVEELITDMDNDNDGKIGHEEFMEVLTKK